jgi:predicted RNA-binding Zn ribbon-like protein
VTELVRNRDSDDADGGPQLAASLRLVLRSDGRIVPDPQGDAVAWLSGAVLSEIQRAQQTDTWRRLKICRNHNCSGAFYDRSKNNSGVWHDVRTCGNAVNLRASRARRRQAARETS